MSRQQIAIIGSGISGLTCAHYLHQHHDITMYEANTYIGGHVNTVDRKDSDGHKVPVDTGFIVFNHKTYPNFVKLLHDLAVPYQESHMSFSVKAPNINLEYCGNTLNTLFGQRRNLFRPKFHKMLKEILRFNRSAANISDTYTGTIDDYLVQNNYTGWFKQYFIVPMGAAIWSSSFEQVLSMPAVFFIRFFENHGMLNVYDQPTWYTISNGARNYVKTLTEPFRQNIHLNTPVISISRRQDGIYIKTSQGEKRYDKVINACHADIALKMLEKPSTLEQEILSAFPYSSNTATLHCDTNVMPKRKRTWAAWNYLIDKEDPQKRATLTYNMSLLQSLPGKDTVMVTLNSDAEIDKMKIERSIQYHHPIFQPDSLKYQQRHNEISGVDGIYYCGAYWRNGFHEDGCWSGIRVCKQLGVDIS